LVKALSTPRFTWQDPIKWWSIIGVRKAIVQCWYDGKEFAIYDFEERNYGIVLPPSTIIATIDSIHTHYGLDFPAADFFYPAFTDDLIESSDRIEYLGQAIIDGLECFQIIAQSKTMTTQIWIRNDAYNLPVKYVITYNTKTWSSAIRSHLFGMAGKPGYPECRV
jgi:hypothetical protein